MKSFSPPLRKLALTAHVVSSVGWLGAVVCFLALAVVGLRGEDPLRARAAYLAMQLSAGVAVAAVLLAHQELLRNTIANSRLDLLQFSLQRFNTAREHVSRVEVRATDAAGRPVSLDWDENTGPPLVQEK